MRLLILLLFVGCTTIPDTKPEPLPDPKPIPASCSDARETTEGSLVRWASSCSIKKMVILNGTGAVCRYYRSVGIAYANSGYDVICPEFKNTGSGKECYEALKREQPFKEVLLSGHSQGGQGAASCAYYLNRDLPEVAVSLLPVFPGWGANARGMLRELPSLKLQASIVLMGEKDEVVPGKWVAYGFRLLPDPKELIICEGAGHLRPHQCWIDMAKRFD